MYPIAWSIVDAENTANWMWFISKLKDDLNMNNDGRWTFISDKQKGLVRSLEELCPNAEHMFCAMHLYNNMGKLHTGIGLRGLMWSAARSTTDYHFEKNMAAIKKLNLKYYEWLAGKPKEHWSRSGFRTTCKSDLFVNNHYEVFNSSINKIRHLPIITMLKSIHSAVMRRVQRRMLEAEAWDGTFTPNSLDKLNEANKKATGCHVTWSGGPRFLVQTSSGGYEVVVDMEAKTCHCRKWQLNGVPCFHAIACMNSRRISLESGLHKCYTIDMFKKVYSHHVELMNGKEGWAKTAYTQPLPPNKKPRTGRPKMKRNKKNDTPAPPGATSLKRMKTSLRCGKCQQWGHNRRTCKNKTTEQGDGHVNIATEEVDYQAQLEQEEVEHAEDNVQEEGVFVEQEAEKVNNTTEFTPGESQPTNEVNDSQGGIFGQTSATQPTSACGVAPKAWQKKQKIVTTRAEILKVRSVREKKANKRYQD
ncbi:uncharacterized protein LOC141719285 [Apium graveolens]|uniref:uncharacterized protein LOC141719285 n=1 Tax=Apium graveolens TaxID=4045 RepID=UPI003D7958C6